MMREESDTLRLATREGEDGPAGRSDDLAFEAEEDDVSGDRSNIYIKPLKHSKTLNGKKHVQMADPSESRSLSRRESLEQMVNPASIVEPGINPGTPSNLAVAVLELPADANEQLHRETEAQKKMRQDDYQKMLEARFVGWRYQDSPEWTQARPQDIRLGFAADRTPLPAKPLNDAFKFVSPRSEEELEQAALAFCHRNTHLRILDGAELPIKADTQFIVKEVKNVHINSDHQRAYIWELVYPAVSEDSYETYQLWLRVYSLAECWSSQSAHSQELLQKVERLQQCSAEVTRLVEERKRYQTVV